ncbi:hypothetical protein BDV59DRAFT_24250 [Aspergillus ambiguus]|uniref:uncharacterized protein n=1 Tax=Aspergillus ambiguus TaxID=176160 RepID=UPI003CCCF32E
MRTQAEYWRKYLAGSSPCLFPQLTTKEKKDKTKKQTAPIALDRDREIRSFCHQNGVSPLNVFQLVWASILSRFAASDDVVFGYRENSTFDGTLVLEEESIYRIRFPLDSSILGRLRLNNSRSPRHRAFQTGSIPATMRLAGYKGQRLFNTCLYVEPSGEGITSPIQGSMPFSTHSSYPSQMDMTRQYDVIVKITVAEDATTCSIVYSSACLGEAHAEQLAVTFRNVLDAILAHGDESTDELDLFAHASSSAFAMDASKHAHIFPHNSIPERYPDQPTALALAHGEGRYQKLQGMSV